jgi:hypothetical protein
MTTKEKMNTSKKTARIVGALFLFSNFTFILGAIVLIEPNLSAPDYLTIVSENRIQIVLGVLLEILNGIAYVGIALLMYPILKRRFESLALGYVGFRIVEFVMQIITDISPLSLLTLSEEYVKARAPAAASFQTMGTLLLADRYLAFQMVSITFGLSALIFYYMLYQLKLIPRFISVWGLFGAAAVLVNLVFDLFAVTIVNLGVLMLLNELFLGMWLIAKGFNSPAIGSESAK